MIARLFPVCLLAAALLGASCTDTKLPTSSVDDSTFVRTMIELQKVSDDTSIDSLMKDSTRRIILRRHGLTANELVQAARAMAYDPEHAERVWNAITNAGRDVRPDGRPFTRPNPAVHLGPPPRR